ncbi:cell adhesion molecule Dscam1-like [Dermacentor variabilis]|uniref:cell adhesion molecule Dscam1-like n=1 Tax=Dermacentor variabilis TaxID=34621 RepID=UPI003F5C5E4A
MLVAQCRHRSDLSYAWAPRAPMTKRGNTDDVYGEIVDKDMVLVPIGTRLLPTMFRITMLQLSLRFVFTLVLLSSTMASCSANELARPVFLVEPPNRVVFSNATGAHVPCSVSGSPRLQVTWHTHQGHAIDSPSGAAVAKGTAATASGTGGPEDVLVASATPNGLRRVLQDGTLVFRAFGEREYAADVHHATYRCSATNGVGTIVSRDVKVRAVILEEFEAHVHDDYVPKGNTALFRCHVPSTLRQYLSVSSWTTEDGLVIGRHETQSPTELGPKYRVTSDGDLCVFGATDASDARHRYRCHVRHRLTGDIRPSVSAGSLFVTEPNGKLAPRILKGQASVEAALGEDAEMPCLARGHPAPTTRWFRRSPRGTLMPVRSGSLHLPGALLLRAVRESDQGRYTCLANNSVGEDRTDTELLVRPNASVVVLPEEARVDLGRAVTFNCSARGFRGAVASTWWVHDGAPLKANPPRVALRSDDQRLHIASVQREDAGIYQCFVRYGDATAQASAQLRLREVHSKRSVQNRVSRRWNGQNSYLKSRKETPPELKAVFTRKLVDPGERFSLRCVASGNPLPRVTWALDGGMVGESHRVHYGDFVSSAGDVISYVNVTSATRDDGGLYRCEASNDLGTAWHDDRIDVRGPPRVRPMANLTVTSGTTLVYHCPYTGHPAPKVTWSRGGRDLPHNERQRAFENGTIVITDVTREADEGVYTCRAKTSKQEDSKDLNVKIIKKTVLNPFNFPKTLAEGMQVVITCSVRSGDTPIKIWWLKDGVPFSKTQLNIQEASLGDLGSNLVFNEVGRAHNGRYTCVAENDGGITNHTAELVVFVPPKWKIEPSDKSSIVRSRVTFDCQADGHPPPLIRWKIALGDDAGKAFKSIISNYHMQMFENGSLIINDVEPKDAGQYLCEATNGIGVGLSTVVRLSVHVAAHFKVSYQALRVNKGEQARLICEAYGEKPLTITWKKDNMILDHRYISSFTQDDTPTPDGLTSSLLFAATERSDSGLYTCLTTNKFGKDETNIKLLVQETPDPPDDIRVAEATSRRISLRWNTPFNGNSDILGYFVQWKEVSGSWQKDSRHIEVPGSNTSAVLDDLEPITAYHLRVLSVNKFGRSEPSPMISVTTDEEVPSKPPEDLVVVPVTSQTLKASWKPPPNFSAHGRIRGYYVGYKPVGSGESFVYKTIDVLDGFVPEISINNLKRSTKYSVIVQAFNGKGAGPPSTEITAQTFEHDPPLPPVIHVVSTSASAVTVSWDLSAKEAKPITGFVLYWKSETGDWSEQGVDGAATSHTFQDLNCGTRYHFYAVAFNDVGRSEPSSSVSATTSGGAPLAPEKSELLSSNSSAVQLNLRSWKDGGCPIRFFTLQYKLRGEREWTPVPETIDAVASDTYALGGFHPGAWYHLLMSASNDAGSTEAQFVFATLTAGGATIPPMTLHPEESTAFPRSVTLVVPIICAFIVALVIGAVVYMICKRRTRTHDYSATAQVSERACGGDMKGDSISMTSVGKKVYEAPRGDPLYFPSPYATTHISVYSGDADSPSGGAHRGHPNAAMGSGGGGGGVAGDCGPLTGRPEHTYDVPFPPKQFPAQLPREFDDGDPHYTSIFRTNQNGTTDGEGHWDELLLERASYNATEARYDRLPRQHFSLYGQKAEQKPTERISDEDSNLDEGENRPFEGNTATSENLEMSEAECDRDFQIYSKKGRNLSLVQYGKTRPAHAVSYVTYH